MIIYEKSCYLPSRVCSIDTPVICFSLSELYKTYALTSGRLTNLYHILIAESQAVTRVFLKWDFVKASNLFSAIT